MLQGSVSDFLTFRRMVTPIIIQVVFWIGAVLCVISGIVMVFSGIGSHYGGGEMVIMGLLWLFLGPLLVRIYCEILIVLFRMNETLTDIKQNTTPRHDLPSV